MDFLEKIVAVKRKEVEQLKVISPLDELQAKTRGLPPGRDFPGAIKAGCSIIAEVKRQSPSRGILRAGIDPVELALLYEKNGAAAISVLTDSEFFRGEPEDLSDVRRNVGIPVLRKDFIIDPYQIYETKLIGADALLLISGLLTTKVLQRYIQIARSLELWPLVEVHSRADLEIALDAGAEVIGINNRDLKTFSTDIKNTLELVSHVPADKILISESGIRNRKDIETLLKAGVHAFLIGEALVTADDPGQKLRGLLS